MNEVKVACKFEREDANERIFKCDFYEGDKLVASVELPEEIVKIMFTPPDKE